jgi:hypothetical protein
VTTPLALLGRRAFALSAVCSAALHVISLGHVTNPVVAAVMVAMAFGCLYCARDLWTRGTSRSWTLVALMNLAMIGVHLPMAAHHHGASVTLPAVPTGSTAMTLATVLAVIEVVIAAAVLFHRTRGLAPS